MPTKSTVLLVILSVLLIGTVPAHAQSDTPLTDGNGFEWDIKPDGVVISGTNNVFDRAFEVRLNGETLDSYAAKPSESNDVILEGTKDTLQLTRRIKVLNNPAAIRYLETVRTTNNQAEECELLISSKLNGSHQKILSTSGKEVKGQLPSGERGMAVLSSDNKPSVLFLVNGNEQVNLNCVMTNGRFICKYTFTVPADKPVSIVHLTAQRSSENLSDAETLKNQVKPFYSNDKLQLDVPNRLAKSVLNMQVETTDTNVTEYRRVLAPLEAALKQSEMLRGKLDQVTLTNDSHLKGVLNWSSLEVDTVFGTTTLSPDDVALIFGASGGQRQPTVYLRNGEVYRGTITADKLMLKEQSGLDIPLDASQIDAAVLGTNKETDGKPPRNTELFVSTNNGNRLALKNDEPFSLQAQTPYGPLKITPDLLQTITISGQPQPMSEIHLNNGSHIPGVITEGTLRGQHEQFGDVQILGVQISSLVNFLSEPDEKNGDRSDNNESRAVLNLNANYTVYGDFQFGPFRASSSDKPISIGPENVETLERMSGIEKPGDEPTFKITLKGGSQVNGTFQEKFIQVDIGGQTLQVPQHMIQTYSRSNEEN